MSVKFHNPTQINIRIIQTVPTRRTSGMTVFTTKVSPVGPVCFVVIIVVGVDDAEAVSVCFKWLSFSNSGIGFLVIRPQVLGDRGGGGCTVSGRPCYVINGMILWKMNELFWYLITGQRESVQIYGLWFEWNKKNIPSNWGLKGGAFNLYM